MDEIHEQTDPQKEGHQKHPIMEPWNKGCTVWDTCIQFQQNNFCSGCDELDPDHDVEPPRYYQRHLRNKRIPPTQSPCNPPSCGCGR